MTSSRKPAPVSRLTMICAAAAVSAALAGCQSGAGIAAGRAAQQGQPAAPLLGTDSDAFIGLADRELSSVLGKPRQVRKDAPAEIWQYSGADCVVDFYLYDAEGRMEVAFVEARDTKAERTPTERCVKSLLQSVSTGQGGAGSL